MFSSDGEEEIGTVPDDLADTQEEDFESEEQWRKQRHEREVFLRQMMVVFFLHLYFIRYYDATRASSALSDRI